MGLFSPLWTVIGIMIFIVLLIKFWGIWLIVVGIFIVLMIIAGFYQQS